MDTYVGVNNLSRKVKKMYVGVETTYTPVEYLESSGTQYIPIDVVATGTTKIEVEYQFLQSGDMQFGSGPWADDNSHSKFCIHADTTYFILGLGGNVATTFPTDFLKHIFTLDAPNKTGSVDNVTTSFSSYQLETSIYPFTIFARATQEDFGQYIHSGRFYSAKIYESGTLVRDLIPVLDGNNTPCIFDKMQQKFYYNIGTGDLTTGTLGAETTVFGSRKITEGYVGVNNLSREFFRGYTLTDFSSSIVPTSWTCLGNTVTNQYVVYKASNTYGVWACWCEQRASSTARSNDKAFDASDTTYFSGESGKTTKHRMYFPRGITIKPTKLKIIVNRVGNGSTFWGRDVKTKQWEKLYEITNNISSKTTFTPAVSTNNYFDMFFAQFQPFSSGYNVLAYTVEITEGTIKDER